MRIELRIELTGGAWLARLPARARALLFPAWTPAGPPPRAEAAFQLGFSLHREGRLDEAAGFYAEALALAPRHAPALNFLGMLACQRDDAVRAVELISAAVAIDPGQPGFHSNLALALNAVGRGREAVESCDRAIALDPDCVEAHSNRGNSLWGLGRRDGALASYARAVAIEPAHAQTHWNDGFLRMQLGLFETGWQKQEWRWHLPHMRGDLREFAAPLWLGKEDLAGKTLLLHAEQGLGDTIQFCRYARLAAARGATVILEVQKPLKKLLSGIEGASAVVARGESLPGFDLHTPLLSLPLAFGTTLATVPAEHAYLRCDPQDTALWRERLGEQKGERVGLVWKAAGANRSIPLADMLGLAAPGKEFFSLQNGVPATQQALLDSHPSIRQLTAGLRNFADAPLVTLMDLVITVDTSMAHLAAALGRPVWLLLSFNPEWRWLLVREDSPWYPTMRLFRQPAPDDWGSVLARVRSELQAWRATPSPHR